MPLDLDFYITIGGTDVTKDTTSWSLDDNEEKISTITVILVSPDNRYFGKFSTQDEISLSWGSSSNMMGPVEFKVRHIKEQWHKDGAMVLVRALDWTERLTGLNYKGMFPHGDPVKAAEEALKKAGLKPEVQMKAGKTPKDFKEQANNHSGHRLLDKLQEKCSPLSYYGDEEPYPEVQKADKTSGGGGGGVSIKKGPTVHGGTAKSPIDPKAGAGALAKEAKDTMEEYRVGNQAKNAGSLSIRGNLILADYPYMKAKECVTVLGVGGAGSGIWYVASVKHNWNVRSGYHAHCHLLRIDTKKDKNKTAPAQSGSGNAKPMSMKGAPIVRYAKIFEKNAVYIGPRKLNAGSQATFTVGDGKNVTSWDWTVNVQVPKDSGDQATHEKLAPNLPNKKYEVEAWQGAVQPHGEPTT